MAGPRFFVEQQRSTSAVDDRVRSRRSIDGLIGAVQDLATSFPAGRSWDNGPRSLLGGNATECRSSPRGIDRFQVVEPSEIAVGSADTRSVLQRERRNRCVGYQGPVYLAFRQESAQDLPVPFAGFQ